MKRLLVLVGLIGVAAVGVRKLFNTEEGTIESGAAKAAASVRSQAPGVAESVASGIEKAGSATEKGASTLREATEKGTNTIREMTADEATDSEAEPEEAT